MPVRARYRRQQATRQPEIQLHARITGSFEFLCPRCGKMKQVSHVNVRDPRWQCRGCRRVWVFGVAFADMQANSLPPFHAAAPEGVPGGLTHVRVYNFCNAFAYRPAIARITGNLEFWCPSCRAHNRQAPSFDTSQVVCEGCQKNFYVIPLLHSPVPGAHRQTPIDWIPPYGFAEAVQGDHLHPPDLEVARAAREDRAETAGA